MIACKSATKQVPSGNNDNCNDFKEFKPQDFWQQPSIWRDSGCV